MTTFVNEKRVCGGTREPVGTAGETFFWANYEIKCPNCNKWSKHYGSISQQVGDDPNVQEYICEACAAEVIANEPAFQS